jgi:hypothetical protein
MELIWIILIIIGIALAVWFAWGIISPHIYEEPDFEIERVLNDVEIRRYNKANIIRTTASTPNSAFSILAGYIFGKNQEKEKIAMTVPVKVEDMDEDTVNMTFFLPKKYDKAQLPIPLLKDVIIDTQDEKKVAVLRFYGRLTQKKRKKYERKLIETLNSNQIDFQGNVFYMSYADPFVPPPLRKTEIAIEIASD